MSARGLPTQAKDSNCRSLTPAQPNQSAATVRDYCSGFYMLDSRIYNVARNYLPNSIGEKFKVADFKSARMLELLQRSGHALIEASESISAVAADGALAKSLEVPQGSPLLAMRLVYFGEGMLPLALTHLFFPGDMYEHTIRLTGRIG